ncbi:MAG: hypothetical protein AB8G11_17205 [Saprospiraceae bacterium]
MKTILQIIILLCVSISLSAQKITCEELMKLPLGQYLFENNDDALLKVFNNLEKCGVEKYELDLSLLSIFIANISGEKGREATVQDLYNEILIFRQQNDTEKIKVSNERRETFYKTYNQKIVTKANLKEGKSLICEVFSFDETEFETFTNSLFEAESEKLDINYLILIEQYQTYVKENYHLSKVAKRDSTDFDFGDKTGFPSMNYFARTVQNLYSNKPTLIYFYGYGTVNSAKLNDDIFHNIELCNLVKSKFNFITLSVDDRRKLPQNLKEKLESKYPKNGLSYVGSLNMLLEKEIINTDTQPYFVVLNSTGQVIEKFDYNVTKDAVSFVEGLRDTLK